MLSWKEDATMAFNDRIRKIRKQRGLTQVQMSELMGIHLNTLKKYEIAYAQPSLEVLRKIAIALNITTDELVFDHEERDPTGDLKLQFEALSKLPEIDQMTIANIITSLVVKNQTLNMANMLNPKSGTNAPS